MLSSPCTLLMSRVTARGQGHSAGRVARQLVMAAGLTVREGPARSQHPCFLERPTVVLCCESV